MASAYDRPHGSDPHPRRRAPALGLCAGGPAGCRRIGAGRGRAGSGHRHHPRHRSARAERGRGLLAGAWCGHPGRHRGRRPRLLAGSPLRRQHQAMAMARAAPPAHERGPALLRASWREEHPARPLHAGVRAIVPIVAGLAGMPIARFYVVNVLSAVLWAACHILPAVAVGASIALAGAVGGRLALLLVVAIVSLWLLVFLARRGLRLGLPLLARGLEALWSWSGTHDGWLARRVRAFLPPAPGILPDATAPRRRHPRRRLGVPGRPRGRGDGRAPDRRQHRRLPLPSGPALALGRPRSRHGHRVRRRRGRDVRDGRGDGLALLARTTARGRPISSPP